MRIIKKVYAAVSRLINNAFLSLVKVPAGIFLLIMILRDKKTNHIIICDHIGDFVITMGYLPEFRKKQSSKTMIYISPKMEGLLNCYPESFDGYRILKPSILNLLLCVGQTNLGQVFIEKCSNIYLINPANAFVSDFFKYPVKFPDMTLLKCIRYGCLELVGNHDFAPPVFSPKDSGFCGDCILLCPEAVVTRALPEELFQELFFACSGQGYQVYINATDASEDRYPGGNLVKMELATLCNWVQENNVTVIGIRSGLLDLLSYASPRVIAVYPEDDKYMDFFDLQKLPGHRAEVFQLRYEKNILPKISTILELKEI